jgi:hypothetical protein
MLGWGALLVVPPPLRTPGLFVMVAVELAIPAWAERAGHTPWHRAHLAERHGLFTIIVLGESVLAATVAVQSVVDGDGATSAVMGTILGAPLVVFAMWWIYSSEPDGSSAPDRVLTWAYGHYAIFASAAAVGAGIVVVVDEASGHASVGPAVAASAVTVPVAAYLLSVWVVHLRAHRERGAARLAFPAPRQLRSAPPGSLNRYRLRPRAERARRCPHPADRPHSAEAVRRRRCARRHLGTCRCRRWLHAHLTQRGLSRLVFRQRGRACSRDQIDDGTAGEDPVPGRGAAGRPAAVRWSR